MLLSKATQQLCSGSYLAHARRERQQYYINQQEVLLALLQHSEFLWPRNYSNKSLKHAYSSTTIFRLKQTELDQSNFCVNEEGCVLLEKIECIGHENGN